MGIGPLGFGMMRLPQRSENPEDIDIGQLKRMVDLFLSRGFTYFDTSYVYHNGASESAVRKALVERHDRNSYTLASKFPTFLFPQGEKVGEIFEEQLERCGVDYFDYYLLHNLNRVVYDREVVPQQLFLYMKAWKNAGKIRHIGFSFHDDAEILDRILCEHPEVEFVQIIVNYYDWREPFIQAKKCLEVIQRHGRKCVVMEPVKGGMLARLPEEAEALLREAAPDCTPAGQALRFAASQDNVLAVLSGMSTYSQVEENTRLMEEFKPMGKLERLSLSNAKLLLMRHWKYACEDMKSLDENRYQVPISAILRAYNSILLQPDPCFAAELNYYKSFRSDYDRAFETGDYSDVTKKIGGAFDVTAALREAVQFETEHSFQSYVD